jgi:hypothetical protein
MRNDIKLTHRGEVFVDIVNALLFLVMGYAIVRALGVVVVKIGQGLGIA